MGLRETINDNRRMVGILGLALIILVVAFGLLWVYVLKGGAPAAQQKAFFTTDDGATWFEDDATKIPPFDHDGKSAVLAHVYSCDGGKTRFVGYLERINPAMKQAFEEARASGDVNELMAQQMTEVQKPGDGGTAWVQMQREMAHPDITDVKNPAGQGPAPREIIPGK